MITRLTKNIIQGKHFDAVSFCGTSDKPLCHIVKAKVIKGELSILDTQSISNTDVHTLKTVVKGQVHLNINNDQVLQKKLPVSPASCEQIVQQGFPNIQLDDFYFEVFRTQLATFVCICRKEYVNNLITTFEKNQVLITHWSLGVYAIQQLLPYMPLHEEITLPGSILEVAEGNIVSIENNTRANVEHTYAIENMQVSAKYLLPFSGVLRSFMHYDISMVSNYNPERLKQEGLFKEHRLYKLGLPIAIGILLSVFFANFMFYNFYYQGVDRLSQITEVNKMQRKVLITKDSLVHQKQKLFDDVIASASSSASLFVDGMVAIMPEAILLDQINYQPLLRTIRKKKPVLLDQNNMLVIGKTRDNMALTRWITMLENLSYVKEATLKVNALGSFTQFEIAIKLGGHEY